MTECECSTDMQVSSVDEFGILNCGCEDPTTYFGTPVFGNYNYNADSHSCDVTCADDNAAPASNVCEC